MAPRAIELVCEMRSAKRSVSSDKNACARSFPTVLYRIGFRDGVAFCDSFPKQRRERFSVRRKSVLRIRGEYPYVSDTKKTATSPEPEQSMGQYGRAGKSLLFLLSVSYPHPTKDTTSWERGVNTGEYCSNVLLMKVEHVYCYVTIGVQH